jgi:hypothetical protein
MEPLNIPATRNTPAILFDPAGARFTIVGSSIPENASAFYQPIISWVHTHMDALPAHTNFAFSLPYFNSSSLKAIYLLLMEVKRGVDTGKQFTLTWHMEADDDFMSEAGETFREMVGMDITITTDELAA